ncbi:9711_t:CDS:1 [Funneliformis caledonium]|uniref:9711_t:CDS:1 n=1 Tax=Funneliformis caledonium TaxID=1117310 RepID=A0A9N9G930_9GLOM|nr:9711_t:CDS:1 [Funneliformis caledonium]
MKSSSQRKLRSQERTGVNEPLMTQLTNMDEQLSTPPVQSVNQSLNQHDANTSFYSVSSVPIEEFKTIQTESSNLQSLSSDTSESSFFINRSNSSYYSISRSSSLSLSRGNSFIGTESVHSANSRSRATSPFVISETSSGLHSESTRSVSSVNQSYFSVLNDENSVHGDNCSKPTEDAGPFRQPSGVQHLENSTTSVVQGESETSPGIGIENNNVQVVNLEDIRQHSGFLRHILNHVHLSLQGIFNVMVWMILKLYRITLKYFFEPVWNKFRIIGATRGLDDSMVVTRTITMIDGNQSTDNNSTMMTSGSDAVRSRSNLVKWLLLSARDNWMVYAVIVMIVMLIPCNVTNFQNLEFAECIPKFNHIFRRYSDLQISIFHRFDSLNNDIEFEQNDTLIRDVVANQVKTVCAAEVQKRIPSQNNDLVRYRSNHVSEGLVVDMVRQEIRKAVEEMLYTYSQDKLNKADFALSTGGAKVISPLTSPTFEQWPTQWYGAAIAKLTGHGITRGKPPVTALQPDTHVGQCWPFAGQKGQLAVLLSRQIYVTAITYDHVSKSIAMGTTSAPKEFEVWGFSDIDPNVPSDLQSDHKSDHNPDNDHAEYISTVTTNVNSYPTVEPDSNVLVSSHLHLFGRDLKLGSSSNHLFLGRFVYDVNGSPIQTFEVNQLNKPISAIIMKVNSNWDNPSYTCLYRFRVHGVRPDVNNETS